MEKKSATQRDRFFDLEGLRSGVPVTRRLLFSISAAILAFFICYALPLSQYGENTSLALGFLSMILVLMIFCPVGIAIPALAIVVGGVFFGFWDYATAATTFGKSAFLSILGMTIVALGCEYTPFGTRIAYWMLKTFGQRPAAIVVVVGVVVAVLSAFCSNVAVILMFSGICAGMLKTMGEEPGKSKFGKTLMLVITMAGCAGGMALISGSPTGNINAINFMTEASGGLYTVTYAQWAVMGVTSMAICIVPFCLIYVKVCRLKNGDLQPLPKEYYEELLQELGPIGGSEIRWILIVICMVACMLSGMNTALAALLFAGISMLPVIGTVPAEEAFKRMPLQMMIAMGFVNLMASLFSGTGLGDLMRDLICPLVGGAGPLGFMILSALITGILINVFVNAQTAAYALTLSAFTPVCMSLGYNPAIVLLPTMFISSYFFCMGPSAMSLLNKGYGYWEMKDPMLPGFLVVILGAVVFSVVCYLVGPVIGMPVFV